MTNVAAAHPAAALAAAGFPLIPLRPQSKIPTRTDWTSIKAGEYTPAPNTNYGIAIPDGVVVVDVDPRNFKPGDRPLARLLKDIGASFEGTFVVKTGGGGLHIYLTVPAGTAVKNELKETYPGIEFKAHGRQVVGPDSIHPQTLKPYTVAAGHPSKLLPMPLPLLSLIQRVAVPFSEVDGLSEYVNDAATQARFSSYLQDVAPPSVEGQHGDENAFRVAAFGRDLGLPPGTTWELMVEIWNKRCQPEWDAEELRVKVVNAYRYARGPIGGNNPAAVFDAVKEDIQSEKVAWVTNKNGVPTKCFYNLLNWLRVKTGGLRGVFGYNEFTQRVEFTAPAPWHRGKMPPGSRGVGDADLKQLKAYLAVKHSFEVSVSEIEEAVTVVAHANNFHPVREYLDSVAARWDGVKRLDTWLSVYLGVKDTEYTRAVAAKTLCAAVARIYKPGCKFDHVLVLEGAQGIGKSSVCRILGGEWAGDFTIDPHNKDTVQTMQGRWIVEIAELEFRGRAEEDAVKAFITREVDTARLAYGRLVAEFPRQSIFIASKNPGADGTYLKDETGNRRWWPVHCRPIGGMVDFAGFQAVRDQLWAEAVVRWKSGKERLDMHTVDLKEKAAEAAAERHADHPWTERIAEWLHNMKPQPDFVTGRQVFVDALGGMDRVYDQRASRAIASVLRTLGWVVHVKRDGDRLVRGFERRGVVTSSAGKGLDGLGDLW